MSTMDDVYMLAGAVTFFVGAALVASPWFLVVGGLGISAMGRWS